MTKLEAIQKHISENYGADYEVEQLDAETFRHGKNEFRVLCDDEADEACAEYIKDSLWAFNLQFLIGYMPCFKGLSDRAAMDLSNALQRIQEEMCESSNALFETLVGNNLSWVIQDAISSDGRGHYLAPYDFEENEENGYFIYKQ